MSLESAKEQLVRLLRDPDYKVIAISGKWGTGKSHMWGEVKKASTDEAVKGSLYVSLFGLSDISSIKLKIVQSALPIADTNPALLERMRVGIEGATKILKSLHGGFAAIDQLALLAVPSILKDKFIVLDDIERKHGRLDIDEVLGFIDEFTQQHGARFILILNSDQLKEQDVWATFHEKVVDQEIRLTTSPSESFRIALKLTPSAYAERIYPTVETCALTNIRIIRKVVKAVNRILAGHDGLSDAVLNRLIPSIVLLASIHYKGIEDGPTTQFVLDQGTASDWRFAREEDDEETEDGRRKARWTGLLTQLGIISCDAFELIVVEFLESGMFDTSAVSEIIERYRGEDDMFRARNDYGNYFDAVLWDVSKSEEQLLEDAGALARRSHLVDAHWITSFHSTVRGIPGGQAIADLAIENWLADFRSKDHANFEFDDPFSRELHPSIKAEFDALALRAQSQITAFDACIHIAKHNGWGPRQEIALKGACASDFDQILRTKPPADLKRFMKGMMDLSSCKKSYEQHFGSAMDNFIHACRDIVRANDMPRLAALIRQLFVNAKLERELHDL